ncbi:MAG TPA: peptidylprolyl isomerase [Stellaceae bacterium]|nr:peptidylprolyl isomerase [Stellaceae bacterium]
MAYRVLIAASLAVLMAMPAFAAEQKSKGASKGAPSKGAAAELAKSGGEDPVVARINGQVLHRSDLELQLRNAPPQIQQQPLDKVYPALLNNIVNAQLLEQAAKKAKIDQNAQVKQELAAAQTQILVNAYVASIARSQITEAKLRQAYDQYAKEAPKTEEVHARHILVSSEQEAKDIIDQLKKGADFATLAKDKTIDPSGKSNGGDLGYFTKQDMVPEFANAAFAMKPGDFSQTPVHTQFGWHVIKVEDKRQGKAGTYEQVAPEIAQQMTQQIVSAKLKELAGQAKIELFDQNGKALASNAPAPQAAPKPQQQAQPAAPTLAIPGGGLGGGAPPPPTLSPATAPDKLGK